MTARDRQRRRDESRELAWLLQRDLERAKYLGRDAVAVRIVVVGADELPVAVELKETEKC